MILCFCWISGGLGSRASSPVARITRSRTTGERTWERKPRSGKRRQRSLCLPPHPTPPPPPRPESPPIILRLQRLIRMTRASVSRWTEAASPVATTLSRRRSTTRKLSSIATWRIKFGPTTLCRPPPRSPDWDSRSATPRTRRRGTATVYVLCGRWTTKVCTFEAEGRSPLKERFLLYQLDRILLRSTLNYGSILVN